MVHWDLILGDDGKLIYWDMNASKAAMDGVVELEWSAPTLGMCQGLGIVLGVQLAVSWRFQIQPTNVCCLTGPITALQFHADGQALVVATRESMFSADWCRVQPPPNVNTYVRNAKKE